MAGKNRMEMKKENADKKDPFLDQKTIQFVMKIGETAKSLDLTVTESLIGAELFLIGCLDQIGAKESPVCLLEMISYIIETYLKVLRKKNTNQQT